MRALSVLAAVLAVAALANGQGAWGPWSWTAEDEAWLREALRGPPAPVDHEFIGWGQATARGNGTAMLLDAGGDDAYVAPSPQAQGFVPHGQLALAVLWDASGADSYTNPRAGNNTVWTNGTLGIGLDGLAGLRGSTICVRPVPGCL